MTTPDRLALPKYLRVAAAVRRQIADGTLRPGQPAPSGAELSRAFGFSTLTCRKALRALIADGLLVPGPSRNARPRVADPQAPDLERDLAEAARALSAGLAARRHAAGLTQAELAALARVSVTTVGHAETGRTWQSRNFWERADAALRASGDLLRLHDVYRAAYPAGTRPPEGEIPAVSPGGAGSAHRHPDPFRPARAGAIQVGTAHVEPAHAPNVAPVAVGPSRIVIVWTDGTTTTVHAPDVLLARPNTIPDAER